MLRKLLDIFTVFNFIFAVAVTGGFLYVESNREQLREEFNARVILYLKDMVSDLVPKLVKETVSDTLPTETGPSIPTF